MHTMPLNPLFVLPSAVLQSPLSNCLVSLHSVSFPIVHERETKRTATVQIEMTIEMTIHLIIPLLPFKTNHSLALKTGLFSAHVSITVFSFLAPSGRVPRELVLYLCECLFQTTPPQKKCSNDSKGTLM